MPFFRRECFHPDIYKLFETSVLFKRVLAGEISLSSFAKTDAYLALYQTAMEFISLESLNSITSEGVICAWLFKLRFNQQMCDEDFFHFIQQADLIFSGKFKYLNILDKNHRDNDLISLMWGVLALASYQGCPFGAIKVRFQEQIANFLYAEFKRYARLRYSTHAQFTRIGYLGLGKDLVVARHRQYTPFGMGTILFHRAFQNDIDAKCYYSTQQEPSNFDILFKIQVSGLNDSWAQTILHWMVMSPVFGKLRVRYPSYKKTFLAKEAEKMFGVYRSHPRREHISYIPQVLNEALLKLLMYLKLHVDKKIEIDYLAAILKYQITFGLPWEIKYWKLNGIKAPLGSFIKELDCYKDIFLQHPKLKVAYQQLEVLNEIILSDDKQDLSFRREGFEILVDISKGKASPKSIGQLNQEPILIRRLNKLTTYWRRQAIE